MRFTGDQHRIDRDAELVEALRRREATAAERLVATFGDRMYRLAVGIAGNQQDAEEAVQDAFLNVIQRIETFRGESALASWVYRITANAAYQTCRRRTHRRNEISLDEVLPPFGDDGHYVDPIIDWSTDVDDPAVQGELRSVLVLALQQLPDHYRAVIVLRDVEGLSLAEIADCLAIPVATAKTRAHRARLLLRKRLGMFMSGVSSAVAVTPQAPRHRALMAES